MITGGALLIFHVPFRGSFLLLLVCALLFLMTSLGAGLFLSTISHTQQQAMMASFFFSTPAFMLSGFTFPIRNMPLAVQYLTYLNPLRYFMEIVRGIFLKGVGLSVLWPQMAGAGGVRRGDHDPERAAVPQASGLSTRFRRYEDWRAYRSLTVAAQLATSCYRRPQAEPRL